MIIYKTTNLVNGKIYVGRDSNDNPDYMGSGLLILRAIEKHGKEKFKKETIEICDGNNWEEREIYWIEKLDARNPKIGYNISMGGDGFPPGKKHYNFGKHLSAKTRKKISLANKRRITLLKNHD